MSDKLSISELIKKGEKLNLPILVATKTFLDANIVDVEPITLSTWCREGKFTGARKIGMYWYVDWRQFLLWFDDISKTSDGRSRYRSG